MAEVASSLGTTYSIAVGEPATYDEAGFEALTWIVVGEVADIGEFGGEAEVLTHTPVDTGKVQKLKGSLNYGQQAIQFAKVFDDVGQVAMKSAFDGANKLAMHSARVVYADGYAEYSVGIVTSFMTTVGSASSIRGGSSNMELSDEILEVAP